MTTGYTIIRKHTGRMLSCVAMAVLMSVASCVDDDLFPRQETDGRIAFRVGEGGGLVTRAEAGKDGSAAAPASIPLYLGGDTLKMTFFAEPNRGMEVSEKPLTRGVPFDEETNKVKQFTVSAYLDDESSYFEEQITTDDTGLGLTDYYWPSGSLSFGAYACTIEDKGTTDLEWTAGAGSLSGSFTYTLPTSDNKDDAKNEPDLVFAIKSDQQRTSAPVNLLFHHALSAIVFKVGKMPEGITLKSITLDKVYSSGSCNMTSDNDTVKFEWEPQGEPDGKYTQQLNDQPAVEGEYFGKNDTVFTFLMLPQDMVTEEKDSVQLQLAFSIGGEEHTYTHTFSGIVDIWQPDTKYTFIIGLPDDIDVEVTDEVEFTTKKNVQIQNTGISDGYIRAAIVGYWIDATGNIVSPWKESEDGDFVWGDDWSTHWEKGDDGFYYHLQPVEHNQYTFPLFVTYTLKEEAKTQHAGQKLELNIVAQIVIADKVGEAWPGCPIPIQMQQ